MSGPLWQATLAYTAGFYAHTDPVSATRVPTAALWFAKTPADREINNMACCHLTAVLL